MVNIYNRPMDPMGFLNMPPKPFPLRCLSSKTGAVSPLEVEVMAAGKLRKGASLSEAWRWMKG